MRCSVCIEIVMIYASVACVLGFEFDDADLNYTTFESQTSRDPRFLFVPNYRGLRFPNTDCVDDTGTGRAGSCYTPYECRVFGGRAAGQCAAGHGVCCIVVKTCGGRTDAKHSYFVSPGYPQRFMGRRTCTLRVKKCHPTACQLRLDFEPVSMLSAPMAQGECRDRLVIEGGGTEVPELCGQLTDQHVYVNYQEEDVTIDISFIIGGGTDSRAWVVHITQIGCDSADRVMAGCLQYFTAISGTVMSFNFDTSATSTINENIDLPGTREIQSLNYGVCIAAAPDYCRIRWSKSSNNSFVVSGDGGSLQSPTFNPPALSGSVCSEDYVIIPNGHLRGSEERADRYCGTNFRPITTESKPFMLYVVTNDMEFDPSNLGFSLDYVQRRCDTFDEDVPADTRIK